MTFLARPLNALDKNQDTIINSNPPVADDVVFYNELPVGRIEAVRRMPRIASFKTFDCRDNSLCSTL